MFDSLPEFFVKIAFVPGAIFAFFLIFAVHEFGHYWAARLKKMKIETFSVGFGKKLYSVTDRHGTEWIFRIFPFGGHVNITDLTLDENTQSRRSVWTRMFVVFAGPGANLLLPFIILPLCFLLIGFPIRPPIISAVEKGMPAQEAGLQRNDIVTHVDGKKILSYDDVGDKIIGSNGNNIKLTIERNGVPISIEITPELEIYEDLAHINREFYKIGIMNALSPMYFDFIREINGEDIEDLKDNDKREKIIDVLDQEIELGLQGADDETHYYNVIIKRNLNEHLFEQDHRHEDAFFLGPIKGNQFVSLSPLEYVQRGVYEAGHIFWLMVKMPFQIFPLDPLIFAEKVPFYSGGDYYYENLIYRAAFQTALLSILIGFINLLPFPRLDGDFLLTYSMESYLKKKPSRKQRAMAIGISLFTIYAVVLLSNLGDFPNYVELKMEELEERIEDWKEE